MRIHNKLDRLEVKKIKLITENGLLGVDVPRGIQARANVWRRGR